MQSSTPLSDLPQGEALRTGQRRVLKEALERRRGSLTVQLPTGYGKTRTAAAVYAGLKKAGVVTRLLYIVPTVAQLRQFEQDAAADFRACGLSGPLTPSDLTYKPLVSIKAHRGDKAQVFVTTVQALTAPGSSVLTLVREGLLDSGSWMVVVDECHHYGMDRAWGKLVAGLPCVFRLAMSATPFRDGADEAFGKPEVVVSYRSAVEEGAVKTLKCHAYVYKIDAVLEDGGIRSYTTEELAVEAGSSDPDAIERLKIQRKMRWSPKYVSPLVDRPIARMLATRIVTGGRAQAIVGAMSCSHAELVCSQVKTMYPELRVDWVGTGMSGRPDETNRAVLGRFNPPKVDGARRWEDVGLDVLVHVAMAGEGLDSVFVTEVVHLNPANINNQNNQECGRAARIMPGIPAGEQVGYVNVDGCSPYADHTGRAIMAVLDGDEDEAPDEEEKQEKPDGEIGDLPDEADVRIFHMELERIDEGHEEVQRMKRAYCGTYQWPESVLDDPGHKVHAVALRTYLAMRRKEAEQHNSVATAKQWQETVNAAVRVVVREAMRLMAAPDTRFDKSLPGDLTKRVQKKRAELFHVFAESDVDELKRQYGWLVALQREMKSGAGLPSWLA